MRIALGSIFAFALALHATAASSGTNSAAQKPDPHFSDLPLPSKTAPAQPAKPTQTDSGKPKAARAVGMLMAKNPDAPKTPCHRVVASDGTLHGYSGKGGILGKKKMLIEEGVVFKGEKVDLEKSQWNV